jgi:uncharacterized protein HemY
MPYANLTIDLDDAQRQALLDKIAELESTMSYMVELIRKEKLSCLRLGPKAITFSITARELAQQNTHLLPPYFDLAAFAQDVQDYQYLSDVLVQLTKLQQGLQNTVIALEQESINAALDFYKHSKAASLQNVSGAQEVVRTLSQMMPKKGKGKRRL